MLDMPMRRSRAFHFFQNVFYSIHLSMVSQSCAVWKRRESDKGFYRKGLYSVGNEWGINRNYRWRINVFMNLNNYFPLHIKFYG